MKLLLLLSLGLLAGCNQSYQNDLELSEIHFKNGWMAKDISDKCQELGERAPKRCEEFKNVDSAWEGHLKRAHEK